MSTRIDLSEQLCVAPMVGLDPSGASVLVAAECVAVLFDAHTGAEIASFPWAAEGEDGESVEMLVDGREDDLDEMDPGEMFGIPCVVAFSSCGRWFAVACGHHTGSTGFNDAYLFDREHPGRPIRYLDINRAAPSSTGLLVYNDAEAMLFTERELFMVGDFGLLAFALDEPAVRRVALPPIESKLGLKYTAGRGSSLAHRDGLLAVGFCDSIFLVRGAEIERELRSPGDVHLGKHLAFSSADELVVTDRDDAANAWRANLTTGEWSATPLGARPVWLAGDGSSVITEDASKALTRVALATGRRTRITRAASLGKSKLLGVSGAGTSIARTIGGTTLGDDTLAVAVTRLRRKPARDS